MKTVLQVGGWCCIASCLAMAGCGSASEESDGDSDRIGTAHQALDSAFCQQYAYGVYSRCSANHYPGAECQIQYQQAYDECINR